MVIVGDKDREYNIIYKLMLDKICSLKSKDYFFESIIGCDLDFLKCLDKESKNMDVYIRVLIRNKNENSVSEIIKLRNNLEIKKCIVFTNRSLRDIDSLKDIGEDEFNSLIDIDILKKYIKSMEMAIEGDSRYHKFCDFLENLITCIAPEIEKIIIYLKKVNTDYVLNGNLAVNERLALTANRNLYIFFMWASANKAFLTKGKINKIYLSSKPVIIHKRINSIAQISSLNSAAISDNKRNLRTSSFAKPSECKNILFDMLCKHKYQEAYRQIYYEYVEQILGKKNKSDSEKEDLALEVDMKNVDIYWLALQYLVSMGGEYTIDKTSLEKQEIEKDTNSSDENFILQVVEKNNRQHFYSIPYSTDMIGEMEREVEKIFSWGEEENDKRRRKYKEHWDEVIQLCRNLNISHDIRKSISEKIDNFSKVWGNFKNTGYTPGRFQKYLSASENTFEEFYKLAQYIMMLDMETRRKIASSGLLEKIVCVDMVWDEDNLYISCYNPLLIFYLRQVNNRNYACFEYCNEGGELFDYQLHFLEEYNQNIPNDIIQIDGIKYMHILADDKYSFPYYLKYKAMDSVASLETINLLETIQYINEYIWENPYKNAIRLCLIGDINLESAKMYIKKLERIAEKERIGKFIIQIVTKGADSTRAILKEILDIRQGYGESIEIKIENLNNKQYNNLKLKAYISACDVVFLLDSSFMYREAKYRVEKQSNLRNVINYQNLEEERQYLGVPKEENEFSMAVIPDIINCFQNASIELELRQGKWDKYTLNMKPMMDIINEMRIQTEEDKTVVFFSSDETLDRKIENEEYLKTIKEGKNGNRKLKVAVWKSTDRRNKVNINQEGKGYLEINLTGLLDTFLSEETLDILWKNVRVRIFYNFFPSQIGIQVWSPAFNADDGVQKEKVRYIINKYIISSLNEQFWLCKMTREIVIQNFWNAADSLEDLVFVYALKNNSSVAIDYIDSMEIENKNTEFYIPPSQKKIWSNNVLQLFEILEKDSYNPEMIRELDTLMGKDNCQIKTEDCRYILKALKKYMNQNNNHDVINNLKKYIGGDI